MTTDKPENPFDAPCYIDPGMQGMTLRDYFAAAALQAIIGFHGHVNCPSKRAYEIADQMLKARQS